MFLLTSVLSGTRGGNTARLDTGSLNVGVITEKAGRYGTFKKLRAVRIRIELWLLNPQVLYWKVFISRRKHTME